MQPYDQPGRWPEPAVDSRLPRTKKGESYSDTGTSWRGQFK
jgi:hypothetical protein